MRVLVSYSLFSADPHRYAQHLPAIFCAWDHLLPSAGIRVYLETNLLGSSATVFLEAAASSSLVEIVPRPRSRALEGSVWRFGPFEDLALGRLDAFFPRDLDSVPLPSEARSMRRFLDSAACASSLTPDSVNRVAVGRFIPAGLSGWKAAISAVPGFRSWEEFRGHDLEGAPFVYGWEEELLWRRAASLSGLVLWSVSPGAPHRRLAWADAIAPPPDPGEPDRLLALLSEWPGHRSRHDPLVLRALASKVPGARAEFVRGWLASGRPA